MAGFAQFIGIDCGDDSEIVGPQTIAVETIVVGAEGTAGLALGPAQNLARIFREGAKAGQQQHSRAAGKLQHTARLLRRFEF